MIHKVITLFPFLAIIFSLPYSPILPIQPLVDDNQKDQFNDFDFSHDVFHAIAQFQGSQQTHDWSLTLTPSMSQRQSEVQSSQETFGYSTTNPTINQVWKEKRWCVD
jgi:hypothetical protein